MRHKFRVFDYDAENAADHVKGMYSSPTKRIGHAKRAAAHVEPIGSIDSDKEGLSVRSSKIDGELSFTPRARLAIIVGLSLFLWAVLIGIAVVLLG